MFSMISRTKKKKKKKERRKEREREEKDRKKSKTMHDGDREESYNVQGIRYPECNEVLPGPLPPFRLDW